MEGANHQVRLIDFLVKEGKGQDNGEKEGAEERDLSFYFPFSFLLLSPRSTVLSERRKSAAHPNWLGVSHT
jgi:hypothetical protein